MNKNISAAIILALAVVLLSACGKGAGHQTETAGSTSSSAAQTSGTAAAVTEADTQAEKETQPAGMSEKTQKVYDYICEGFGKQMLSCQQESTWMGSPDYEMDYIRESTGKLPAMRGLDFMNNDFAGVVKRSEEWDAKGGLVTICWHTGVNGSGYQESLYLVIDSPRKHCRNCVTQMYRCCGDPSTNLTANGSGGARAVPIIS